MSSDHTQTNQGSDTAAITGQSLNQQIKNEAAIALLNSWSAGDEQEQRETWEYLKKALDEDRFSSRKLFP